jgi:hypothetical protein
LCGGYQIGGMESLTVYQFLYMWEWLRAGSVFLLAVCCALLGATVVRRLTGAASRADLLSVLGLASLGGAYLVLRYFADHAGLFAAINIGQHRHALDVTFASIALALLLAALAAAGQFRAPPPIGIAFAVSRSISGSARCLRPPTPRWCGRRFRVTRTACCRPPTACSRSPRCGAISAKTFI